jgi:NADH:ubiquinone oxidoreductase subunit D
VYCNYLGGGLRGAIAPGGYNKDVPVRVAKKIDDFCVVCKERYQEIEKSWAEDPEAYTDEWTEEGTQRCREAGIVSAY